MLPQVGHIVAGTVVVQGQQGVPVAVHIAADGGKLYPVVQRRQPQRLHPAAGKPHGPQTVCVEAPVLFQPVDESCQVPGQHPQYRDAQRLSHVCQPVAVALQSFRQPPGVLRVLPPLSKAPAVRTHRHAALFCQLQTVIVMVMIDLFGNGRVVPHTGDRVLSGTVVPRRAKDHRGVLSSADRRQKEQGHPDLRFHLDPPVLPADTLLCEDGLHSASILYTTFHFTCSQQGMQKASGIFPPLPEFLRGAAPESVLPGVAVVLAQHGGKGTVEPLLGRQLLRLSHR